MRSKNGATRESMMNTCRGHLLVLAALMISTAAICCAAPAPARVIVTTTHLAAIVREVGRESVSVTTIIPGGMCPGHVDISPAMARQIADADMFFSHAWEQWAQRALAGAGNPRLRTAVIKTQGNLMVPEHNTTAAHEAAEALCGVDPSGAGRYRAHAAAYEARVLGETRSLRGRFAGKKAVCSQHQEQLLAWLGFEILASYGRQEDMSLKGMAGTMRAAKTGRADIVVDNIQSGANAGRQLARDLRIPHAALTNFPQDESYLATLRDNVRALEQALK